jgi:hypothetical protein
VPRRLSRLNLTIAIRIGSVAIQSKGFRDLGFDAEPIEVLGENKKGGSAATQLGGR